MSLVIREVDDGQHAETARTMSDCEITHNSSLLYWAHHIFFFFFFFLFCL